MRGLRYHSVKLVGTSTTTYRHSCSTLRYAWTRWMRPSREYVHRRVGVNGSASKHLRPGDRLEVCANLLSSKSCDAGVG